MKLRSFYQFRFDGFCTEIFFTIRGGDFRIKPCTGKDIHVYAFLVFRKMCCYGACFNELYEGVTGGNRAFMTEVRNECAPVALHMDDIVAKLYDEFPDFCPG